MPTLKSLEKSVASSRRAGPYRRQLESLHSSCGAARNMSDMPRALTPSAPAANRARPMAHRVSIIFDDRPEPIATQAASAQSDEVARVFVATDIRTEAPLRHCPSVPGLRRAFCRSGDSSRGGQPLAASVALLFQQQRLRVVKPLLLAEDASQQRQHTDVAERQIGRYLCGGQQSFASHLFCFRQLSTVSE